MNKNDFIKTLVINGTKVDLGLDDYGQCYFIEWEENGQKKETGLGTYNFHYLERIYYLFDDKYRTLSRKWLFGEDMTPDEQNSWDEYTEKIDKEYEDIEYREALNVR